MGAYVIRGIAQKVLDIDLGFSEQIEQDAGGEVFEFLGVAVGFAAQTGEVDADAVILALNGKGVSLALEVSLIGTDQPLGLPAVGAEGDVGA